ncbi:MAG: hypothetical protein JNJ63_02340 [Hyphomonadaceae bacterium]|nr:hypothetical protein [Hyphomonadaceae bacterium]
MKLALFLGAAVTAVTLAAASAETTSRVIVRHGGGPDINFDANNDGWLTRAEATAAADRAFEHMDVNHDGRLTAEDRQAMHEMHVRVDGPDVHIEDDGHGERHVRVIRRGDSDIDDAEIEAEIERAMAEAHRGVEQAEREAHRAERHAREAEREARDAERHTERRVVIIRGDDDEAADLPGMPPMPPMPPHPPMFMMLVANSDEADTNGDGALSREEFRAQQLRFFDASDANSDGRIRFEAPPEPPQPPEPPEPPAPPRR